MTTSPPLHDPGFWAGDPYPTFAELRRDDPVHRYEGEAGALWAVTRHADVLAVSKDPATFCSGKGVLLTDLTRPVLSTDSILYLDPPLHAKRRKLVSPSLTVRRVADLEDRVRRIVTDLLDGLPTGEPIDAVERLSMPLPLMVIAELVGVPESDLADFRRWSDAMIEAASEFTDEALALAAELFVYIDAIVQDRHAEARDDLVSVLAHGTVDGEAVSDEDINMFVLTLLVAGNETTRTLISNSLVALHEHPDQRKLLAEEPARLPVAVEELLRWEAPIMSFCRTATRDTTLSGTPIAEGDYLLLCYQSANRDEDVFGPTADRLDVTRTPNPHVSFGYAEHYCLGAGLARLEARVLFEELLARWPGYEVVGPVDRLPSRLARGVLHLPLVLGA
ncbi:MAG TPA: cytochrome P450 [Acidimicrobiales bacterium]|nr:cytochrome P450 [Acidimicrobiales bacterium]